MFWPCDGECLRQVCGAQLALIPPKTLIVSFIFLHFHLNYCTYGKMHSIKVVSVWLLLALLTDSCLLFLPSLVPSLLYILGMHFTNLHHSWEVIMYMEILQLFSTERNIYLEISATAMPPSLPFLVDISATTRVEV